MIRILLSSERDHVKEKCQDNARIPGCNEPICASTCKDPM